MDTVEEMDLAAAGFRREVAWLADLADELGGQGDTAAVEDEVEDVLRRLPETYTAAQDAYLTAKVWDMEVEHLREEDEIGPAVARREQRRCDAVIEDYRAATDRVEDTAPVITQYLDIDIWDRIDPDTQIYDHAEYVEDMDFDIEYGGLFRAIDVAEGLYDRAGRVYSRLT